MTETATTVTPTATPILAPSLKPGEGGVGVGVAAEATADGAFCVVVSAATAKLAEALDVPARRDVLADEVVVIFVAADVFDVGLEVLASRLTVVKGVPSSRFLMLGSALHG